MLGAACGQLFSKVFSFLLLLFIRLTVVKSKISISFWNSLKFAIWWKMFLILLAKIFFSLMQEKSIFQQAFLWITSEASKVSKVSEVWLLYYFDKYFLIFSYFKQLILNYPSKASQIRVKILFESFKILLISFQIVSKLMI